MASRRTLLTIVAAWLVVAAQSGALATQKALREEASPKPLAISATTIEAFERAAPSRRRFGRLEFLGGLALTADNEDFGGLSDLVVAPDGRQLLAVSDEGNWIAAEIVHAGSRPAGLTQARIGPLLAVSRANLPRKRDHDAEGITLLEGSLTRGTVLIGFERKHRIGRFPVVGGALRAPSGYLNLPEDARGMRSNKAFEAITVLRGGPLNGAVVAVAERFHDAAGHHTGWIWIKGVPRRFAITDVGGFDITSMAALDDGAVLLLERRFRWAEGIKMRLRHVRPGSIAPHAVVTGEVLLEADNGYEIDNMEGLAVHAGPAGATVLTLISDNNFNALLQRTLLLQFSLAPEGLAAAKPR
jgi:hypothetical protein